MEEQIIERIHAATDARVLNTELQRNRARQDYLHAVCEGEKQATRDYLNSSSLFFPENVTEETNRLGSWLVPIEKELKHLERIERAIVQQLEKLKKA